MSSFWSKRRDAVAEETRAEAAATDAAQRAEVEASQAEKTDAELLEELGLPDPETLGEGADFRAFLKDHVPARLKKRALRHLWRVNPLLANLDGLVDYADDYTDAATCVKDLKTSYIVGKGILWSRPVIEAVEPEPDEADPDETEPEPEVADPPVVALAEVAPEPLTDTADPEFAASRRRMQFSFPTEGAA